MHSVLECVHTVLGSCTASSYLRAHPALELLKLFKYYNKKNTLMMIFDPLTDVHVVGDRHRKRLLDRATVKECANGVTAYRVRC